MTQTILTFSTTTPESETIYHDNGQALGCLEIDNDGYYHFWPDRSRTGYWTHAILCEIVARLDVLNNKTPALDISGLTPEQVKRVKAFVARLPKEAT